MQEETHSHTDPADIFKQSHQIKPQILAVFLRQQPINLTVDEVEVLVHSRTQHWSPNLISALHFQQCGVEMSLGYFRTDFLMRYTKDKEEAEEREGISSKKGAVRAS